jgi:DNA-directed RNA polymerase specialized sigma24 family protein
MRAVTAKAIAPSMRRLGMRHERDQANAAAVREIKRIYSNGYRGFLRVAHAISGDAGAARTIVHDVFVAAVRRRSMRAEPRQLERHLWRSLLREAANGSALGEVRGGSPAHELRIATAKLTDRERLALYLREFGGLDDTASGAVLGLRAEAVGAAVASAHRLLTSALERDRKETTDERQAV